MLLFLIAFMAGVLTVLAPCVLPLLPVIVGGSVSGGVNRARAYTVAFSLGASVILFTLLLKFSTTFIGVPEYAWQWFSGGVLIGFGVITLFPQIWDRIGLVNTVSRESNKLMSSGFMWQNFWGDVLVGAALGPVFSTCSPTYFVILATVLPASFGLGLLDLLSYTAGLVLMLLFVSLVGQRIVDKLGIAADPRGVFRKVIGALFIVVGVLVFSGAEAPIESWLIANVFDVTKIEQNLLELRSTTEGQGELLCDGKPCQKPEDVSASSTSAAGENVVVSEGAVAAAAAKKAMQYPRAPEISKAAGYVNTSGKPITIGEFKGKKVVLIDFWTYSCINCQRTLPYLKAWDEKYRDQGLEIIGIHTPEFAFERVQSNVENAVQKFGLKYPSVLDNDYGTWNAFGNSFWPRKYLIDIDGFIVYDHAGEGNYEETEKAIQKVLAERAQRFGKATPQNAVTTAADVGAITDVKAGSPETYFGSARNEFFASGSPGVGGVQTFGATKTIELNKLYLTGTWNITPEYAETADSVSADTEARIIYQYQAKALYLVAGADTSIDVEVMRDGKALDESVAGKDVMFKNGRSYISVKENRLYDVVKESAASSHKIEFIISAPGLQVYTFTFG